MEYSKLIKTPFPPVDEAVKERDKQIIYDYYKYEKGIFYRAEIISGTLSITLYGRKRNEKSVKALYRHFYDGKTYATLDLITGKKLTGMIDAYTGLYHTPDPVSEADRKAIVDFFVSTIYYADFRTLRDCEREMKKEKALLSYKKECDVWSERNSVISSVPDEFVEWIRNDVLRPYKFYYYNKKEKIGFCSDCRKSFFADTGHNKQLVCPKCGATLTTVSLKKRKYNSIRYYETAIYLDKVTEKDGSDAVVLRFFKISNCFEHFHEGILQFNANVYIRESYRRFYNLDFTHKKSNKDNEFEYCYTSYKQDTSLDWRSSKRVPESCLIKDSYIYPGNAELLKDALSKEKKNVDIEAIIKAIKCRPAEVLKAAMVYPSLENFAKLEYNCFCYGIYDYCNHSWRYRGTIEKIPVMTEPSPFKLLNVSKDEFSKMKRSCITIEDYLRFFELKEIRSLSIDDFVEMKRRDIDASQSVIREIMKIFPMSYSKLMGYLDKQSHPRSINRKELLITFRDYLTLLTKLKLPITASTVFTQHLVKEHDSLNAIYFDSTKPEQNKKLMKRTKILDMLTYDNGTYLIRPLYKASEFVQESTVLSHCVKTYIDRCAAGSTNIYGIRKSEAPDTPYFTLTLDNTGKVVTNLGKKNCHPPKEVTAFVREWEKKVISVKLNEFLKAIGGKSA